jgi:enoyl-CoA hydratase
VRLGIPFYPSGIERFLKRVSPGAVKRILLACEKLDAATLLESGYLDAVVAAGELDARVSELAARLAVLPPMAAQAMKAQLNRFDRESAGKALRDCLASAEHRDALAAWTKKR